MYRPLFLKKFKIIFTCGTFVRLSCYNKDLTSSELLMAKVENVELSEDQLSSISGGLAYPNNEIKCPQCGEKYSRVKVIDGGYAYFCDCCHVEWREYI